MTQDQIDSIKALSRCTFLPGSNAKRFVRNMAAAAEHRPEIDLTDKQAKYLADLIRMYRRQLAGNGFSFPEMSP
jgi:hypothetical protein